MINFSRLNILVLFFFLSTVKNALSQDLYMPVTYKKSYESGVRTYEGKPGPDYWINHADYEIDAAFDPGQGIVTGQEKITYYNESPDSISQLVVKLLQDLYKIGNEHDNPIDPANLHSGIKLNALKVNGQKVSLEGRDVRRSGTNLIIHLRQSLKPGKKVEVEISWELPMSKPGIGSRRTGGYDSTSYFVGYWYPQVAVYDDIDGWDRYNYTGAQETYNDFNNYDVKITVPSTHVIWATGSLENINEVFPARIEERYRLAQESDTVIHVIQVDDLDFFKKRKGTTTYHFRAENVMDFAFGTSDHFLWDVVSTMIGDRRVTAEAAYPLEARDFPEVAAIAKESLEIFSTVFPAVDYPYHKHVTVNAMYGGGMEFPMMANNGSTARLTSTINLTAHEIAHTYFPFLTGINERKYAWMDEGWAEYLADVVLKQKGIGESFSTRWAYRLFGGSNVDLPLMTPSVYIEDSDAVGFNFYFKPHLAYIMLEKILGKEEFDRVIKGYIERWAGKHPTPYDFFFSVNDLGGRNLNWFWRNWFFDFGYADLTLGSVEEADGKLKVEIKNEGGLAVPVMLKVSRSTGDPEFVEKPVEIWENKDSITIEIENAASIEKLEILDTIIPDLKQSNNTLILEQDALGGQ